MSAKDGLKYQLSLCCSIAVTVNRFSFTHTGDVLQLGLLSGNEEVPYFSHLSFSFPPNSAFHNIWKVGKTYFRFLQRTTHEINSKRGLQCSQLINIKGKHSSSCTACCKSNRTPTSKWICRAALGTCPECGKPGFEETQLSGLRNTV